MDGLYIALLTLVVGAVVTVVVAVIQHNAGERAQDSRDEAQRSTEWRGAAMKVRSEVERNREARIALIEQITGIGLLPRDAHEQLRADAWDEESGRLSQLMPREDFEHLQTYYREREKFAEALRDYHRREHTKTDRPRLQENLRRLSEGLEDVERRVLGNSGG
jgi:hypothetical protein